MVMAAFECNPIKDTFMSKNYDMCVIYTPKRDNKHPRPFHSGVCRGRGMVLCATDVVVSLKRSAKFMLMHINEFPRQLMISNELKLYFSRIYPADFEQANENIILFRDEDKPFQVLLET